MPVANHKKDELRVKYTKQRLRETLISLLARKPLGKITVKELCVAADINRSTFYAHYIDLYDLMDRMKEDLLGRINEHLKTMASIRNDDLRPEIEKLLRLLKENAQLYLILIREKGRDSFMNQTWRTTLNHYRNSDKIPDTKSELDFINIASGNSAMIEAWLRRGASVTEREMATLINIFG